MAHAGSPGAPPSEMLGAIAVDRRKAGEEAITEPPGGRRRCGRLPSGSHSPYPSRRLTGPDAGPTVAERTGREPRSQRGRPKQATAGTDRPALARSCRSDSAGSVPQGADAGAAGPPARRNEQRPGEGGVPALAETGRVRCDEHHDAQYPGARPSGCSPGITATGPFPVLRPPARSADRSGGWDFRFSGRNALEKPLADLSRRSRRKPERGSSPSHRAGRQASMGPAAMPAPFCCPGRMRPKRSPARRLDQHISPRPRRLGGLPRRGINPRTMPPRAQDELAVALPEQHGSTSPNTYLFHFGYVFRATLPAGRLIQTHKRFIIRATAP